MPDAVEAAVAAATEAVTLCRTVQDTDPAGHHAGLAAALNRLGFLQCLRRARQSRAAPGVDLPLPVATDVLPILVNACSATCVASLPQPAPLFVSVGCESFDPRPSSSIMDW